MNQRNTLSIIDLAAQSLRDTRDLTRRLGAVPGRRHHVVPRLEEPPAEGPAHRARTAGAGEPRPEVLGECLANVGLLAFLPPVAAAIAANGCSASDAKRFAMTTLLDGQTVSGIRSTAKRRTRAGSSTIATPGAGSPRPWREPSVPATHPRPGPLCRTTSP